MNDLLPGLHVIWDAAGWTMLNFLWLGAAIGLFSALIRFAIRRHAPQTRYAVSLALFTLLTLLPAGLFARRLAHPAASAIPLAAAASDQERLAAAPIQTDALRSATTIQGRGASNAIVAGSRPASGSRPIEPTGNPRIDRNPPDGTAAAKTPASTAAAVESRSGPFLWQQLPRPWRQRIEAGFREGMRLLPWVWLAGFPCMCLWLLLGIAGGGRLRRNCRAVADEALRAHCLRLQQALRVSGRVAIGVSDRIAAPILVGVVRPLILLPAAALSGWSPAQLEMILVHELAHIRRWDNLVNVLQRLAEAVLFFHPAVWWLSGRVRLEREHCCDAVVMAHGGTPQAYAELLARIAIPDFAPHWAFGTSAAGHLAARIRQILKQENQPMQVSRIFVILVLGLCVSIVGLAAGWANSETGTTRPRETEHAAQASAKARESSANAPISRQAAAERPSVTKQAQQKPVDEELRYDGKTFSQWQKQMMTELSPEARDKAIRALGRFGSHHGYTDDAIGAILNFLKSDKLDPGDAGDEKVEEAARWSFSRIGAPAIPSLIGLLKDPDAEVRRFAAETLRVMLGKPGAQKGPVMTALVQATKDAEFHVRWEALTALRMHWNPKSDSTSVVLQAAIERLKDDNPQMRREAARVLALLGHQASSAIPALVAALNDPRNLQEDAKNATVTTFVIGALVQVGAESTVVVPAAADVLTNALNDEKSQIAAAKAIEHFGPRGAAAVPALIEAFSRAERAVESELNEHDQSGRNYAHMFDVEAVCKALGAIGPPAKAAVPVIEQAQQSLKGKAVIHQHLQALSGAIEKIQVGAKKPTEEEPPGA